MAALHHLTGDLSGIVIGGKYRLDSQVGEGGMACVYRGWHNVFQCPIAFKVLFSNLARRAEVRERFRREARVQFQLQHPNIVRVLDTIEEDGLLGIVMDWVEGQDLGHYLEQKNGPLSLVEISRLFVPMLTAIAYAHDHQVIHRDIKPTNVLLEGPEGREIPKIMDFGIAKSLEEDISITKTNSMVGTPTHMSPEQAQSSKNIDHRTDIYSLGVTLFQMLTGRVPFDGNTAWEIVMQHYTTMPPSVTMYRSDVGSEWDQVIQIAMAKFPAQRYSSARAFVRAILPLLPQIDPTSVSQDDLHAVMNSPTASNITAWGLPPVPQGWHPPSVTSLQGASNEPLAPPAPPQENQTELQSPAFEKHAWGPPAQHEHKTRYSWEYTGESGESTSDPSSHPLFLQPQTLLPTGEQWPYTGPSLSVETKPATSQQADPALWETYPEQPVEAAPIHERPEQVTPPYARPLPFYAPDMRGISVPAADVNATQVTQATQVAHDGLDYTFVELPKEQELQQNQQKHRKHTVWLWSIFGTFGALLLVIAIWIGYKFLGANPDTLRTDSNKKQTPTPPTRQDIHSGGAVNWGHREKNTTHVSAKSTEATVQPKQSSATKKRLSDPSENSREPATRQKIADASMSHTKRSAKMRKTRKHSRSTKQADVRVKKRTSPHPNSRSQGNWKLCRVCVSEKFASFRNKEDLGMMEAAEPTCNMHDFKNTGAACADICGSNYVWFCKAAMQASSGRCNAWIHEKSLLSPYIGSLNPSSLQQCRKHWATPSLP